MALAEQLVAKTLREIFGHDSLRPGQAEIIQSIASRPATLAVMPTGSGKSLCYQLPAVALPGTALVVSPLIALIHDQVVALRARGVAAAALTSAESSFEQQAALAALRKGELDLLYVAPERFRSARFIDAIRASTISLFVIDEVHCISEWGHDFRPDYARLGEVIRTLEPAHVVGLTATATVDVQRDIIENLGIADVETIVTGFDRPNLHLSVVETGRGAKTKLRGVSNALEEWIESSGSAIVYVATRKAAEDVADGLRGRGWAAEPYHAGLPSEQRTAIQNRFQAADKRVVVATTAFGMGIDKSDVRVVVHYHVPSSVESYYQEVGRAGRDGAPAAGVLLYDRGDLRYALMRLEASCPSFDTVERAHAFARRRLSRDETLSFDALCEDAVSSLGSSARAAFVVLERFGDLNLDNGRVRVTASSVSVVPEYLQARERRERRRLDAIIAYVDRASCRRRHLVDYFGDLRRPERCGVCDACSRGPATSLDGSALREALMALSCVARMRGRFGRTRVIEVLAGSESQAVLTAGLDRLSTHGLLAHRSRKSIGELLDGLVRAGLASITVGEYPRLALSEAGAETLRSRGPIAMETRAPSRRSKRGGRTKKSVMIRASVAKKRPRS